jgi:parvulin-like peptidyl-prolyl isomerase
LLWNAFAVTGCSDLEQKQPDEYLIKVGDRIMTVGEFNKAFEIAKTAYSYNRIQKPEAIREARLRLVQQMTEEMILLERAKEIGITVTASEVEKALADIKGDYPGNEFQNLLIENAVPYPTWEKGLKRRLLMEKVIAKDLGDQIHITSDDISKYYKAHLGDVTGTPDAEVTEPETPDAEATEPKTPEVKATEKEKQNAVAKKLRREKMENAYTSWMEALKKKYTVEINKEQFQKMTDLKYIRKHLAS